MGFFGKLAFWKHEEEKLPDLPGFGINESAADLTSPHGGYAPTSREQTGLGEFKMPDTPRPSFEEEQTFNYQNITPPPGTPPPQQQGFASFQYNDVASKNMEIISSKLDYLRASLENINQRLANLEAAARGEEQRPKYGYRW